MKNFHYPFIVIGILAIIEINNIYAQATCAPIPAGTASWWRADWNAFDALGNNDGTLINGVSFAPGKVGQAFKFDSIGLTTNQYVSLNKTYALAGGTYGAYPTALIGDFTIDFWAKTDHVKNLNAITRGTPGHIFPINDASKAGIGVYFGTDGVKIIAHSAFYFVTLISWDSPTALTDWTHVAVVFQNNLVKIYVNADLKAETTQLDGSGHLYFPGCGFSGVLNRFEIGGGENDGIFVTNFNHGYFVGLIDELQIIANSLSHSQIQAIFNADVNGQCIPTTVTGQVFNDVDSNCVFNPSIDYPVQNRMIQATDGPFYVFTDNDGKYELNLPDGNYNVTQAPVTNDIFDAVACSPSQVAYDVNVSGGALISGKDFFNVLANPTCAVSVSIQQSPPAPLGSPCPNIPYTICATFDNTGGLPVTNATFSITVDPNLSILSATCNGIPVSPLPPGQTITCSGSLTPANSPYNLCVVVIPCPAPAPSCLNATLTTTASLTGICQGDPNFQSNAVPLIQTVSCAIDPNDKLLVIPKGCGPLGYISGNETLTYRIRFQNTGNAPAHNIVLLDELIADLDLSTLRIVASSHPITKTEIIPANLLRISFIGIELPDSFVNEPASHGFVIFKIKPKSGLQDGTVILDEAGIYFDLNEPVITNSTLNTIRNVIQPVSLTSFNTVCLNDNPFTITGGTPAGGTYSGKGISNGIFYPDSSGVGVHTITYTFTTEVTEINYTLNQSGSYAPIAGSGAQVILGDDQVSSSLPIGFNFNFYGTDYSNFYISSNGFITFNAGSTNGCCSGKFLPHHEANPSNLIALGWTDLYPPGNGFIDYFTTGSAPNRKLVMNFSSIPLCCNSVPKVTTQVILCEGTNIIELHSSSVDITTIGTMGIVNNGGIFGTAVPGRNASSFSITNDFVQFIPPAAASECSNSALSAITVKPKPIATIIANGSTNLCPGQSVTLTSSVADSYLWSNGATTQSLTVSMSGNFTVTVTTNGCSEVSGAVNVVLNNVPCGKDKITICHVPPGNAGNPQTLCISNSALQAHIAHGDYCGPCIQSQAKKDNSTEDWCAYVSNNLKSSMPCVSGINHPCKLIANRDSAIPTVFTPIKYFTLLIVVVDSGVYGVTKENVDTMMSGVNNYFEPWKIQFCYTTDFIDSSQLSNYPQNFDSIINIVIQDWSTLGQSGNPIKIDYSVVTNNNYQGAYTLAHELGHDFQLSHTFNSTEWSPSDTYSGCSSSCRDRVDYSLYQQDTVGDWISDTPPTPKNTICAPAQGTDSCSVGNPPWSALGYENLMGYSFCINATFTLKQTGMMHCFIENGIPGNIIKHQSLLAYGMLHCNPFAAINNVNEENKLLLEIVPNPFSEVTTISVLFSYTDKATVEIYNYLGQPVATIFEKEAMKNQVYRIEFDGKQLRNGIYFVVARTNEEIKISKIVVAK